MKVVILCGGLGSRLSEETSIKPKAMVKFRKISASNMRKKLRRKGLLRKSLYN
tara:strand:+ start:501 stop:659 length:159 start_codon:yes stop_codon:yes gene_type:complete